MKKIIVANWKMNGSIHFMKEFISFLLPTLAQQGNLVTICPPFPLLGLLQIMAGNISVIAGAQNCHAEPCGAFTGEVSASLLAELGCKTVIIGHSERRIHFQETDAMVKAKASAVHAAGMTAIICAGENRQVRQAGLAIETVGRQILASLPPSATPQNTLIAYEPLWAIGTGVAANPADIIAMHEAISGYVSLKFPLLYGGSVTAENAAEILSLPWVDGALIGGASLKKEDFQKIIAL
jgi:triosephosphate isomerase